MIDIEYPYPCRFCSDEILSDNDANFYYTYWRAIKLPICKKHTKSEYKEYQKNEAYECQIIDADCNDCKHFKRGSRRLVRGDNVKTEDGEYTRILVDKDVFYGHCAKFDTPTMAAVNHATGRPCFEHRRGNL